MKTFTWKNTAPALLVIVTGTGCGSGVAPADVGPGGVPPLEETGQARQTSCSAPILYAETHHQSPVRGDPGDLLLLAGTGFAPNTVVVYQAVKFYGAGVPPTPPPMISDVSDGIIAKDVWPSEHGIQLRLPVGLEKGRAYTLWAATPCDGAYAYSNGVMINDARPMWVSPGPLVKAFGATPPTLHPYVYESGTRAGLDRVLEVAGRNLQPMDGMTTQVRLCPLDSQGQADCTVPVVVLDADNDQNDKTQIERYVARVSLPPIPLVNDESTNYAIQVSRDGGTNWVAPSAPSGDPELLTVLPRPAKAPQFFVSDYGLDCDPCAGTDNTHCITDAIKDAANAVSDSTPSVDVVFGTGTCGDGVWRILSDCILSGCNEFDGYDVPDGVNLIGGAPGATIEAGPDFGQAANTWGLGAFQQFLFTLHGHNVVRGLELRDSTPPGTKAPGTSGLVLQGDDIAITDNFFNNLYTGVGFLHDPSNRPITADHLHGVVDVVITNNRFGCWDEGLNLLDTIEDSVIQGNTFWPGGAVAPIATAIQSERRVAIEKNVVDGTVTTFSGSDVHSPVGWRAGMFFPTLGSHEEVLIGANQIMCTGTRTGLDDANNGYDGEAISIDGNISDFAFPWSKDVEAVPASGQGTSALTINTDGLLVTTDPGFFLGRWVRIVQGKGLGQARKIVEPLPVIPSPTGTITLTVAPPFDVPPIAGASRIIISSQAWQTHIVDNVVDNNCTTPKMACSGPCAADEICMGVDRCLPKDPNLVHYNAAGVIMVYGSGVDMGIEGNSQFQTAGIAVYAAQAPKAPAQSTSYFVDVRKNLIDSVFGGVSAGKMNITDNNFGAGIYAFGVTVGKVDPGFGLSITHNVISNAALLRLGSGGDGVAGIALSPISTSAGSPSSEPLFEDTLVFANDVQGMDAPGAGLHSAIANGREETSNPLSGHPNYPANTFVCDNAWSNTWFTKEVGDWPVSGQPSTLHHCSDDPPSP